MQLKKDLFPSNGVRKRRLALGLSQQDLADRAGISRQTITGVEAGLYSVSTAISLRLARALGCRVEDLFWLDEPPKITEVELLDKPIPSEHGPVRVRLARMGTRMVAYPLTGLDAVYTTLLSADGVLLPQPSGSGDDLTGRQVQCFGDLQTAHNTVLVAGCDPAMALLAERTHCQVPGVRVAWFHAGSTTALSMLAGGVVHLAGSHLPDEVSGTFNAPFASRLLAGREAVLVNVAHWEEGLILARGNPKAIRDFSDFGRPEVKIVNREAGSAARRLIDGHLAAAGVDRDRVRGYRWEVPGHLEVAQVVASGRADVGVAIAAGAHIFNLDFIPLVRERYDLTIPLEHLETAVVQALLETLAHRTFRAELEALGGYDVTETGSVVARIGGASRIQGEDKVGRDGGIGNIPGVDDETVKDDQTVKMEGLVRKGPRGGVKEGRVSGP